MTVLIECFHLRNETLVNGVQDMSQKIINRESYKVCSFLGNSHVYQAPKSNCFIAARATVAHKALFNI